MPRLQFLVKALAVVFALHGAFATAVAADDTRLRVALDPGHGGIDPGAMAVGMTEADLVLDFAERLAGRLSETGQFHVVLTRTSDSTVSLDRRLTIAREAEADVFISLHADALAPGDGEATGLTVYTLDDDDIARADARLIEHHQDRQILSGVDLTGASEDVSRTLIAIARRDSRPRSTALAEALLTIFNSQELTVNRRAHRHGGFAVLKAADMPSVLVELGFLTNARDRRRLQSDEWLDRTAEAIRDGLLLWYSEDRVFRQRLFQ